MGSLVQKQVSRCPRNFQKLQRLSAQAQPGPVPPCPVIASSYPPCYVQHNLLEPREKCVYKNPGDLAPEETEAVTSLNQACWLSHMTDACLRSRPGSHSWTLLVHLDTVSRVHPDPGFQDLPWVTGSPGQCMPYFCGMLCTLVCYVPHSAAWCVWYGHPSLLPSSPAWYLSGTWSYLVVYPSWSARSAPRGQPVAFALNMA